MKGICVKIFFVILVCFSISSCLIHTGPTAPITQPSPTPSVCMPGNLSYTNYTGFYLLTDSGGVTVINSQADYIAHYHGYAAVGQPTPTPVPIDFTTKTIIGTPIARNCDEGMGISGITTDCSSVSINVMLTPSCSTIHCNSVFVGMYFFVIDKTFLPVQVNDIIRACP